VSAILICPACGEAIDLTTTVTNENGIAVHQECYVKMGTAEPQEKGIAFPNKLPERAKPQSS
jgi:hypothetical protein